MGKIWERLVLRCWQLGRYQSGGTGNGEESTLSLEVVVVELTMRQGPIVDFGGRVRRIG